MLEIFARKNKNVSMVVLMTVGGAKQFLTLTIEKRYNELIEKISADTIIILKSVAFRKDEYEESKTLFGVVFTECVNDLRTYGSFIDGKTVGKMMKEYVMDMTIPDIQCECLL